MQCFYRSKLFCGFAGALFFLLFPLCLIGKNSLDEHVFLTRKNSHNFQKDLHDGYRAFIITPEASFTGFFSEALKFLETNNKAFLSLILEQEVPGFLTKLKENDLFRFLALPGQQTTDNLTDCLSKNKRLFVFTPDPTAVSFSLKEHACTYQVPAGFPETMATGFTGSPENNLVIFAFDEALNMLADSLKQNPERVPHLFNEYTGKLPNFFVTSQKAVFNTYFKAFSKQEWFTANVIFNNKPLDGISWKEMPLLESFGKIHTTRNELSPKKDGFHFSPDVFTFNSYTSENTKIFYARPKDLNDGMVLMLPFEQSVDNAVATTTEIPYSNIAYKKDSLRGWCAVFNGKDNYIDYDTDIELDNNFTVSAWIKPTAIDGNRSIIGKGKALAVKFRDGNLLFTSPGIKDHVIDSAVVKKNEWQQITFVISIGKTVRFFKNGELVGVDNAADISSTEYSLLIGTNLWDEAFEGMMDDLTIWDRTLSDIEVRRFYNQGIKTYDKPKNLRGLWVLSALVLLASLIIIGLGKKKKKRQYFVAKPKKALILPATKIKRTGPFIEVFGGFRIVNRDGEDLTSRFSTRRKQLFVLVLVATLRENGASSKQLTNYLWAGYPAESAKNNRSTQVQRIREILAQNSGINIEYINKRWIIKSAEDVYCDLADYFLQIEQFKQTLENGIGNEQLGKILSIVEKGPLLPHMDDVWLDDFKSKIADELLETLLPLYSDENFMADVDAVLRLSNALLIFDPLNETILSYKIKALMKLGKNTQAHESLEHFEKYYQQCYAQPFGKSISGLIEPS